MSGTAGGSAVEPAAGRKGTQRAPASAAVAIQVVALRRARKANLLESSPGYGIFEIDREIPFPKSENLSLATSRPPRPA
jgi:hypothetical protein